MIRLYLISMCLIPLVDAFDRLWERYGHHVDYEKHGDAFLWPDKAMCFGTVKNARVNGVLRDLRYIRIKLPIRTWGAIYPQFQYGWRTHHFQWFEGSEYPHGPHIWPPVGD